MDSQDGCYFIQEFEKGGQKHLLMVTDKLHKTLHYPWVAVQDTAGINILLLSRTEEKTIQRRIYFSSGGDETITVHRKPIPKRLLDVILQRTSANSATLEDPLNMFLQHIVTVVRRLQSYEVCVGVDDIEYKFLWPSEKSGEVDNNFFGEQRYCETFRPFACELLVSTSSYLRRRCPTCNQVKLRFSAKVRRRTSSIASATTPNVHLDRNQLIKKVVMQEKKLKSNRAQISKLKRALQKASSRKGVCIDDRLSEGLIRICMSYVNEDGQKGENSGKCEELANHQKTSNAVGEIKNK